MCADIFAVRLAGGARVRGCFALWKRTRHRLALAFESGLFASLVVTTVPMLTFAVPGAIERSEEAQARWGRG